MKRQQRTRHPSCSPYNLEEAANKTPPPNANVHYNLPSGYVHRHADQPQHAAAALVDWNADPPPIFYPDYNYYQYDNSMPIQQDSSACGCMTPATYSAVAADDGQPSYAWQQHSPMEHLQDRDEMLASTSSAAAAAAQIHCSELGESYEYRNFDSQGFTG